MTPTINSAAGTLPAAGSCVPNSSCAAPGAASPYAAPAPVGAAPESEQLSDSAPEIGAATLGAPAATGGGGATDAAQGAIAVSPEQLVPVLQKLVVLLNELVSVLQNQDGTIGGGGAAAVGQCGMSGCTMSHAGEGSNGGVGVPSAAADPVHGAAIAQFAAQLPVPAPAPAPPVQQAPAGGTADPGTVKDKTGTNGLTAAPLRGLEEAHRFGLPLVSGHRPGGPSSSDHTHGDAIDVSTLPIGAASSTEGTPEMKAYAEHVRLEGKAGRLGVKYVILDGKIASSRDDWNWRPYTYPGKSAAEMEAMKSSNRGEYNRMQHHDHVHVSFN